VPIDEVLRICADVSAAIDYAHRRRVVHRDIKPENVMLQSGQAFVLDFGIALALDAMDQPRRTMPGLVPGTAHYMSPEQARGDTSIDGWSDVYSLACVVYEMISGSPPFTGSWGLVVHRHMSAEPVPLCCRMPNVPHGLSAAVTRALGKVPSQRFLTTGEFVSAMRTELPRSRISPDPFDGRAHAPIRMVSITSHCTPVWSPADARSNGRLGSYPILDRAEGES
jgi:serine/threonine-protein kinase